MRKKSSGICGERRLRSDCADAQSDLRPSLSANRIIGYYRIEQGVTAPMILGACVGESESAFCAYSKALIRLRRLI